MKLNSASERKLKGVKPALEKIVRRAAELTTQPFQIVQGNRTQAQQNALYAQGRTKKGPIVTWTKNSKHIGGGAIDFAALVDGKISWNEKYYPAIAKAFKSAAAESRSAITWGGDWRSKDWGHIELGGSVPIVTAPTTKPYDPARAVQFFEKRGWSKFAAAALVAGLIWESGGNKVPTIIWGAEGDKDKKTGEYKSRYAGQWQLSRQKAYEAFAEKNKRSTLDPYAQLAFVDHELNTSEKRAAKALREARTIEEANEAAIKYWRPSIPHAAHRLSIAKKLIA